MTKAFIFDLGNVLVSFDWRKALEKLAAASGRSPEDLLDAFRAGGLEERLDCGLMDGAETYRWLRGQGFGGGYEEFRILWCDNFRELPEMSAIFRGLKGQAALLILSNTHALHYEFIQERFPFVRLADYAILSYKLGVRKPDPRIYLAALEAASAEPHEAVFIDDLQANAEAAASLGINAVHLTAPELGGKLLSAFLPDRGGAEKAVRT